MILYFFGIVYIVTKIGNIVDIYNLSLIKILLNSILYKNTKYFPERVVIVK